MTSPSVPDAIGGPVEVDSIEELVDRVELSNIVVFEVRARRADGGFDLSVDDDEDEVFFAQDGEGAGEDEPRLRGVQIMTRSDDESLQVRAQARIENSRAVIEVDLAAIYDKDAPFEVAHEVANEFIARVSMMSLFPFIREVVHTESMRLGFPMRLGLLKASSVHQAGEQNTDSANG